MTDPAHRPDLHPIETAERQRSTLLRIIRIVFLILFITVTILTILDIGGSGQGSVDFFGIALAMEWPVIVAVAIVLGAVVAIADALTTQRKIATLVSIFFGLITAMLATVAMGAVLDLLAEVYDIQNESLIAIVKVLVGICLAYLCITTVLYTQDDFRLVVPYVEFSKQIRGPQPLLLDTSVLIDARIADITDVGIIQSPVVIPAFVVAELQLLADSGDKLKRARGRRGLDLIGRLQRTGRLDVSIDETPVHGKAVDQMLIELAQRMPATIVTTDLGLNRVAQIQNVTVLNINDLANALKPAVIPGEQLPIKLIKLGEQQGQAIGYLDDGTMVVAENATEMIGQDVILIVTSALQTSAGRLIFGKLHPDSKSQIVAPHSSSLPSPQTPSPSPVPSPPSPPLPEPQAPQPQTSQQDPDKAQPSGPFPPTSPSRPRRARNPRR